MTASTCSPDLSDPLHPDLAAIIVWWDANRRPVPWRATRDVYAVWVAEVMSAQTQVTRAAAAWERWIARWPSVQSLAAAPLREVLGQWQGLGYPRRARDLHRSAGIIVRDGWPEELTELPGVGPYTAAAIRCFAYEEPVLPCDVNVSRVLSRRFPHGVEIHQDPWRSGQALMEFGQRICTARPGCAGCPVAVGCAGPAPLPGRPRGRQKGFAGSQRQRRGRLLAQVLDSGALELAEADAQAAESLVADGLVRLAGAVLRPPD